MDIKNLNKKIEEGIKKLIKEKELSEKIKKEEVIDEDNQIPILNLDDVDLTENDEIN